MSHHSAGSATTVSVSREIGAPAKVLFDILVRVSNHPRIDGSGMLRDPIDDIEITAVGDTFAMAMVNDNLGDYVMTNRVVDFEHNRRLAWEPLLTESSREEAQVRVGVRLGHRWGYVLDPVDEGWTKVTEFYDCTDSPSWLQEGVAGGARWLDAMTASLEKLEALAAD